MKKIALDTWDRKEHFQFFYSMDYPHYHIGTNLDITHFKTRLKERGLPFSFAMTYAVTVVMNQTEAFRYRIRGNDIVLHDQLHPSFTYLAPNKKYFKMVTVDLHQDIMEFCERAQEKALHQENYFIKEDTKERDDLLFISSLPDIFFTHLSHTINFNKEDATPRISWGKYLEENHRFTIPFNVQVNHAFVDGDHLGDFFKNLQQYFDTF